MGLLLLLRRQRLLRHHQIVVHLLKLLELIHLGRHELLLVLQLQLLVLRRELLLLHVHAHLLHHGLRQLGRDRGSQLRLVLDLLEVHLQVLRKLLRLQ